MIRSRVVRSFTLVLATFVALSCSEYSPTAPIAAPTQAQDGLISGLVGIVTNLLGSVLKVIVGVVDPKTEKVKEWVLPTPWAQPYDVVVDKNGVVQYAEVLDVPSDMPDFDAIKAVLGKL